MTDSVIQLLCRFDHIKKTAAAAVWIGKNILLRYNQINLS